jgi:nucleotide-binding universal stress UspA family protein
MRILVPVDGSPSAANAVNYAVGLAAREAATSLEVHLLNVQEAPVPIAETFGHDAAEVATRLARAARVAGADLLANPAKLLESAKIRVHSSVLIGDPASCIAEYVDKYRCDAVIMGTRGLGAITGIVLGSVAAKVVHLVRVPVTLLK